MKSWQTVLLSLSIIVGCLSSAAYLKYQPENRLETNKGPVLLGTVHSEQVLLDASISFPKTGDDVLVQNGSFYDKEKPINESMVKYIEKARVTDDEGNSLSYEDVNPVVDGAKIKLRTYVSYSSSNFDNIPYQLTIEEKEYDLPNGENMKDSIEKAISNNYLIIEPLLETHLFITNTKN